MFGTTGRIVCVLAVLCASPIAVSGEVDDADDPVARIATCLPEGWKVDLVASNRELFIRITTESMATAPSHYGNAERKDTRQPVTIRFQMLPRHSPAMLRRIHDYNAPLTSDLGKIP